MNILKALPVICTLFVLSSFSNPPSLKEKWRKYRFKQGNFKLKLPAKPTLKERRDKYLLETESEGIIYQIEFNKRRQNNDLRFASHLVTKELEKIKRELSLKEKITVENTMGTSMLDLPIQEIRFRNPRKQLYQYRVLITKYYTYRFIIIKYNKTLDKIRANQLFGSFKLLKKEK